MNDSTNKTPLSVSEQLPIDMAAIREVAAAIRAERAQVCEAAGVPDDSGWITELVAPDFGSCQELVAELADGYDYEQVAWVPELCAKALGETGTTRVVDGDCLAQEPFFHHGDLVVKGHLGVGAPFVVTGSLMVEGVLNDCGPDSVVAVHGGVKARGVFTDGEMSIRGDVDAEVVYASYNDHTLQTGVIRARLVIEDDHETIASKIQAELHFDQFDFQQGYGEGVQEQLRELLVDEVFAADEDEEMLSSELLLDRLREGVLVFRSDAEAEIRDRGADA
ncbi:hypothetical protein PUR34_14185 [Streptomyces sp. JV185]|uniref:hypothetical protein n=1 Tax=Streptomyces sp. JV185 TaxID=858638 RepID=UPI002E78622D|nr:hypothetical protein [Streptomyces sp. JV185]MEE1769268.1 hypothetical protein [Streptomyces sp. JV185]